MRRASFLLLLSASCVNDAGGGADGGPFDASGPVHDGAMPSDSGDGDPGDGSTEHDAGLDASVSDDAGLDASVSDAGPDGSSPFDAGVDASLPLDAATDAAPPSDGAVSDDGAVADGGTSPAAPVLRDGTCVWNTQLPPGGLTYHSAVAQGDALRLLTGEFVITREGELSEWDFEASPEVSGGYHELVGALGGRLFMRGAKLWERVSEGWQQRFDKPSQLYGVGSDIVLGTDDALFVVATDNSIHRYDGSNWQEISPARNKVTYDLWWDGTLLWSAGDGGEIRSFDGANWTTITLSTPTSANFVRVGGTELLGTFAATANALYRVSHGEATSSARPTCPNNWTPGPTELLSHGSTLYALQRCNQPYHLFELTSGGWLLRSRVPDFEAKVMLDAEVTDAGHVVMVGSGGYLYDWTGSGIVDLPTTVDAPPSRLLTGEPGDVLYAAYQAGGVAKLVQGDFELVPGTERVRPQTMAFDGTNLFVSAGGSVSRYDEATATLVPEASTSATQLVASSSHVWALTQNLDTSRYEVRRRDGSTWTQLPSLSGCDSRHFLAIAGEDYAVVACNDSLLELSSGQWTAMADSAGQTVSQHGPPDARAILRRASETQAFLNTGSGWVEQTFSVSVGHFGPVGRYVTSSRTGFSVTDGVSAPQTVPFGWPAALIADYDYYTVASLASGSEIAVLYSAMFGSDEEPRAAVLVRCAMPSP